MPTQYCSSCEEERGCGHHHVYVVELRREVLKEKPGFPFEGELPADKKAYYVGETKHSPECRFFQHTAKTPENGKYWCYCPVNDPSEDDVPVERTFKPFLKGEYVKSHGVRLVEEDWIKEQNPVARRKQTFFDTGGVKSKAQKKKALEIEEEVGLKLRLEGHAVHWN